MNEPTVVAERRKAARQRVLKKGTIAFNRAGVISCTLRNMSSAGACLVVASQVGIPDEFTLVIESDRVSKPCRVIWRRNDRIGVEFC